MLSGSTVPSRLIMKRTSAVSVNRVWFVWNWRRTSREMFCRYPGYGNSMPGVSTFATSVPLPPVAPPPAVGGGVSGFGGSAALGCGTGVAAFETGAGLLLAFVGGLIFGGVFAAGTGAGFGTGGVSGG